MYCSVLQCIVVYCSVLQCVEVCKVELVVLILTGHICTYIHIYVYMYIYIHTHRHKYMCTYELGGVRGAHFDGRRVLFCGYGLGYWARCWCDIALCWCDIARRQVAAHVEHGGVRGSEFDGPRV